jgi:hypothetical protein
MGRFFCNTMQEAFDSGSKRSPTEARLLHRLFFNSEDPGVRNQRKLLDYRIVSPDADTLGYLGAPVHRGGFHRLREIRDYLSAKNRPRRAAGHPASPMFPVQSLKNLDTA